MLARVLPVALLLAASAQAAPATDSSGLLLSTRDSMASCDDTSTTYTGTYTDGSGSYVTSDGVSHPYKFPAIRKCWWDYFIVSANLDLDPWKKASGDKYCTGTETCTVQSLDSSQTCQSKSTSLSVEVGLHIESFQLGVSTTTTTEESKCFTATDVSACTWNDGGCHTVWTQQQMLVQEGYRRHRCNWGNGDETECMADWTVRTPTKMVNYGCGSKCSDTNDCGHTDGTSCP